jgi:adenylate kinase
MDAGSLVPDDLILQMMIGRISASEASGGFVLDGFPRTIPQAKGLDERLAKLGQPIDRVVSIEADDSVVSRRLTGRWSCPKDGRVFHELYSPPKRAGVCDLCGTALVRRKDDEPQVVSQRLTTYHAETRPLIDYYRGRGVLTSIDGNAEIEDVYARIVVACRGNG